MIAPEFLQWKSKDEPCFNSYMFQGLQLKPYSDEVYSFLLPQFPAVQISNVQIISKRNPPITLDDFFINTLKNRRILNIKNLLYDDWDWVHLRVNYVSPITPVYIESEPLRITSIGIEKTKYISYRDNDWPFYMGIRIPIMLYHEVKQNENTAYYQISTERSVAVGSKRSTLQRFISELTNITVLNALLDVFTVHLIYLDTYRVWCPEFPSIEPLKGYENFSSMDINLSFNKGDTFTGNFQTNTYVIGNRQLNQIVGDGNNNIINTNINNN